jgi:hypothetical protein
MAPALSGRGGANSPAWSLSWAAASTSRAATLGSDVVLAILSSASAAWRAWKRMLDTTNSPDYAHCKTRGFPFRSAAKVQKWTKASWLRYRSINYGRRHLLLEEEHRRLSARAGNFAVPRSGTKLTLMHLDLVPCSAADRNQAQALGPQMQDYCAYIIGPDGHILNRIDLLCENEDEAKECAVRLVDGQNVELWQRDRRIAEFKRRH